MKIGFVGLGIMGKPMAKNLLKAGYELVVYDIVTKNAEDLVKAGAVAADSGKEVAQQGNGRRNAYHRLTNKSKDNQKSNGLRPEVHHADLIMGEHRIEESGKEGNQTRPQGIGEESDLRDDPIKGGM